MKKIQCEMCGGSNIIKQDDLYVCQDCGVKYTPKAAKTLFIDDENKPRNEKKADNNISEQAPPEHGVNASKGKIADYKDEEINKYRNGEYSADELLVIAKLYFGDQDKKKEYFEKVLEKDPNNGEAHFNLAYTEISTMIEKDPIGAIAKLKDALYAANDMINNSQKTYFEKRHARLNILNLLHPFCSIYLNKTISQYTNDEKRTKQDIEEMKKICLPIAFLMRDCVDLFIDFDGVENTLIQGFINAAALRCINSYVEGMAKLKPYLEPEDLDGEYVDEYLAYPISLLKLNWKNYKEPANIHPL